MTAKELNNMFNSRNTEYKTRLTLVVDVPLTVDDIRRVVNMIDAEQAGDDDAIAHENVSALDFITMWLTSEYGGDVLIQTDEMGPIR